MAEIENITILRVDTGEAVRSVGDLRANVKLLKESLNDLDVGSQEYQDTLNELKVNQNALHDAMYATSASMDDVAKSATGASESYNGLVNRMKALKEEFRSTRDEARRAEIGAQIKEVNDRLKEMDAMQGNFQRNVGNYAGSIKEALKDIPSFASPVKGAIDNIDKSMGLLSKNPLLGIITLLFPLITKITDALKDNKTAIDAVDKAMKALEPVFNVFTTVIETVAGWLSKAVDWIVKLASESKDTFKSIIAGAVGVGDALLQYLLTPIRTIVEAAKGLGNIFRDIFTGNFKQIKEDAGKAFDGIKDAFEKGFDFKGNFKKGKEVGAAWVDGLMTTKPKAQEAGNAIGKSVGQGIADGLDDMEPEIDAAIQRQLDAELKAEEQRKKIAATLAQNRLAEIGKEEAVRTRYAQAYVDDEADRAEAVYQIHADANQRRLEALKKFKEEAAALNDYESVLAYEQEIADLEVDIELDKFERMQTLRRQDEADAKASQEAKVSMMQTAAGSIAALFGSLADLYEADGEENKKAAKKAKALRIAESTVNTIAGAVGAYAQAAGTIPPPYGIILGAIQAATVMAAGMANIAKMRSVSVDGGGSGGSASVSAPTVNVQPQQTTIVQSQSDEEKLNGMFQDQRVYILDSDIEAKNGERQVQVAESSF